MTTPAPESLQSAPVSAQARVDALAWLDSKIQSMPTLTQRMGGQETKYIGRTETLDWIYETRKRYPALSQPPIMVNGLMPTHYCRTCGALWSQHASLHWSLVSVASGKCCENVVMGTQIAAIGLGGAPGPGPEVDELLKALAGLDRSPNTLAARISWTDSVVEAARKLARAIRGNRA